MTFVPLKRICNIISGSGFPYDAQGLLEKELPFYKVSSLNSADGRGFVTSAENSISRKTAIKLRADIVPPGSCLMAKIGAAVALQRVVITTTPAYIDNNMMALAPLPGIYPRYLFYLLQTIALPPVLNPGAIPNLNMELFRNVRVPCPKYSKQVNIDTRLDHELAEIDGLIADQQHLKSLLEERLSSLTFELATDASNSNRYETGHPFWKTLPKGWTLQKLGWHFKVGNSSTPKSDNPEYWTNNPDKGFPWFNSSVVNNEVAMRPARYVTDKALAECNLPFIPTGSLLVGLTGQGKTRGMVTKTGIESTINQHIAYLVPRAGNRITIEFAMPCLQAAYPELPFINDGNGSTKGALTCDQIVNL